RALREAGDPVASTKLAEEAVRTARSLGYRPLEAEALYALGRAHMYLEGSPAATPPLVAAIAAADASRHDEVGARARMRLALALSFHRKEEDGLAWAELAQAAIERLGGDATLEAELAVTRGSIYSRVDRPKEALPYFEQARVIWNKLDTI